MRSIAFVTTLLLPVALAACGPTTAQTSSSPAPVVRTVIVGALPVMSVQYTGTIRAKVESDLGFRVAGKIVERLVDPGQSVRRGQKLMEIDAVDLALVASAAQDRLRAAEADAERAAADEARLRSLVETRAVSVSAYDAALAAKRSTAALLAAARSAAAQAENQRGYAQLVADSDGVVIDVLAQPGQVVAVGTPVVRLGRAGPREAAVSIPENALATLPKAASARFMGASETFAARLREVAGAADPLTRTYAARFALEGDAASAPLGATVTIELPPTTGQGLVVPLASLHDPGSGVGVWVVGPDKRVAFRQVHVMSIGQETAVLAPDALSSGTRVVSLGAHLLRDGEAVRLDVTRAGGVS